jgi:hypothetical protein
LISNKTQKINYDDLKNETLEEKQINIDKYDNNEDDIYELTNQKDNYREHPTFEPSSNIKARKSVQISNPEYEEF